MDCKILPSAWATQASTLGTFTTQLMTWEFTGHPGKVARVQDMPGTLGLLGVLLMWQVN